MVVADPAAELLALVTGAGDPPPASAEPAAQRAAELVRRRFGLSLSPPFAGVPGPDEPVRQAQATDGAAIAAVKWRAFGWSYRGVLPDEFLDRREVVPPVAYWQGRAMLPPSARHRLFVWGRPGRVFGYADTGPARAADGRGVATDEGEIAELYVDPAAQGRGGGTRLLQAAEAWFGSLGCSSAVLSTLVANTRAQEFYERHGWAPTGHGRTTDLGGGTTVEERWYARPLEGGRP